MTLECRHGVVVGAGLTLIAQFVLVFFRPWVRALMFGAHVPMARVIGLRLRGQPAQFLIDAHVINVKRGQRVPFDVVEVVYVTNRITIKTPEHLADLALRKWESGGGRHSTPDDGAGAKPRESEERFTARVPGERRNRRKA